MNKQRKYSYTPNDTTEFFNELNIILYILGLRGFWIEDVKLPKRFVRIYDIISPIVHFIIVIFSILQLGWFFTQKNLTAKQQSEAMVVDTADSISALYLLVNYYYRDKMREILYYLAVVSKEVHNDESIERSFIKKLRFYIIAYTCVSVISLGYYGINAVMQVQAGAPFITVITAWPDVTDTSRLAAVARIIFYILWVIQFFRFSVTLLILLITVIGLSHQYRNLQSYFESLNNIFDDADLSHEEQENKYIEAFVKGIKSHSDTIWCTHQCQNVFRNVFTLQVLLCLGIFVVLMPSMLNPNHTFDEICAHLTIITISLINLGLSMWNGGDITVEASKLPDAIYGSGWYNCYNKSSVRIRSLVVVAITQAQQPVVLKALAVVELSYDTYISIIKSAYSVYSVFY